MIDAAPTLLRELLGESLPAAESPGDQASEAEPQHPSDGSEDPVAARDGGALPIGPIVLGGAGVVLLAVGSGFGAAAASTEDKYANAPVRSKSEAEAADALMDKGKSQALMANVLLGVGAGALLGSLVWWWLSPSEHTAAETALAPVVTPTGAGVVWALRM
jgi:hypothetical protein